MAQKKERHGRELELFTMSQVTRVVKDLSAQQRLRVGRWLTESAIEEIGSEQAMSKVVTQHAGRALLDE